MNICTIVAKNYIAHARVLAESFRKHHPDETCSVLVIDDIEGYIDAAEEPFELVTPADLDIDDYEHMAAIYDVVELSTAVKPWLLAHLLNDCGMERIAYFDPDIQIYDRLDRLDELTREYELVLIPHITSPMPRDGKKPSEADILIAGTYNLGFIALERGARTDRLLDWWSERLKIDCVVAPELGYFVDQRWIDFIHGVMPGFYVLNDPGYNVAYWNLHGRELTDKKGRYYVNGEPLQFFHFSGFDPRRRDRLSKHQSRIELTEGSALARICNEYADSLLERGYDKVKDWSYTYGTLPNGVKLDPGMHRLYRAGTESGELKGSIFTPEGADRFVAWLNEPASVGGEYGVTRYLYEVYSGRPDLRRAFPNLDGADAASFVAWAQIHGDVELPVAKHPATEGDEQLPAGASPTLGVNVAGYFRSELGVGEVARQMTAALETQEIPVATIGVTTQYSRQGHEYETDKIESVYPINLVCVNADALPEFVSWTGARLFENRYSIGMWWWEVSEFPERFVDSFEYLDEVWVGSHHVGDAIASFSPIPVVKVTMPVSMPEIKEFDRSALGLPEGFVFLFVFDYHSVFERKNPLALVEAFKKAFPPDSGASLVLKSINGDQHPEEHECLLRAAEDHPDVHVIDRYVSVDEKNAMIAACDCYVSLHRSEGFGITLAEAMYLEKPVIATAYSGNLDFMTSRNSYLVDYELKPIGEGSEPYPLTGEWAEPDIEHAANLMRHVFEQQEEARERGKRAATEIRRTHSPEVAGRVIAWRLKRIEAHLGAEPRGERPPSTQPQPNTTRFEYTEHTLRPIANTERLAENIAQTPRPVASRSLLDRITGFARRITLKLIWPFAMQQRAVNDQLLTTIQNLDANLREVTQRHQAIDADLLGAVNLHSERLDTLETSPAQLEALDAELKERGAEIEALYAQMEDAARQLKKLASNIQALYPHVEAADRLVAESRALPYMSGSPFEVFEEKTGRVYGYASRNGARRNEGFYDAFEDIFRGSESFIRDRQRRYLDLLEGREPILDAGCGRGEFLDLLRQERIEYIGIDIDPDMVERCRTKGHERVELADVNSYLESLEDGTLGVIFCAQVIEHLPHEELLRFFELSQRQLKPEGLLIAETVNPHSVAAMKAFWVDTSHQHPIFPEVALALCEINGFDSAYAFHPNGSGDVEIDRFQEGEYAVVATKATQK